MDISFLLRGLIIGFSIAAPVGPIGVLCIRRTLAEGRASGLVSGLGAATADAIYGCIAGFGLTFISSLLVGQQTWLRLIGGGFLCYLGLKTFLARPARQAILAGGNGLLGAYASTFFLTLTNPMTILSFVAIFAGLGVASARGDYASAGVLVLGVFMGSALWWLILSGGVSLFRARFDPHRLRWVNRISGVIIAGFGLLALLSLGEILKG
jgi:threonine/homoserine/homoserine lactone efflux protein